MLGEEYFERNAYVKKWKIAAGISFVLCVISLLLIWQIAVKEQIPDSGSITDIVKNEHGSEVVTESQIENSTATETESQTETEEVDGRLYVVEDFSKELQSQLICILDNKDVWLKGAGQPLEEEQREVVQKNIWYYMVSDLDQNGRLEIVCSMIEAEGQYSTSYFYEVNESATGLTPIPYEEAVENESEPDLIANGTDVYYDPEKQIYSYIEEDVVRAGTTDSYIAKSAISIRDGEVHNRILMYAKDSPDYMGTYTIYTDSYGNRIRESKYSDAGRYFEGCEKKRASFAWFVIEYELMENSKEASDEAVLEEDIRLLEQLKDSYEGFLLE